MTGKNKLSEETSEGGGAVTKLQEGGRCCVSVLGCRDKVPHTLGGVPVFWKVCCLPVLEAGSLESRCQQGCVPPQKLQGRILPASSCFWWLQVPLAYSCISPISASVVTWTSLLCVSSLLLRSSAKTVFPNKVIVTATKGQHFNIQPPTDGITRVG